MMNRRTLKHFAWWQLPLLALRAWVPMGFMLSAGEQGLELVYCSGAVRVA